MTDTTHRTQGFFLPAPPVPVAYGRTAAVALVLGLLGGFAAGLYALGVFAFGWPADRFVPLAQAHGQVQTLGLAGLFIVGVGGLLLPGFWKTRLVHPGRIPSGALLVGLGLAAELVGRPLDAGLPRTLLVTLAALLVPAGFLWAGAELGRIRARQPGRPAVWEALLLLAAASLLAALLLRVLDMLSLGHQGGPWHATLVVLELDGFLLAATAGVQVRLLPSLARVGDPPGWAAPLGLVVLAAAVVARVAAVGLAIPLASTLAAWLLLVACAALFVATGLAQRGRAPTVVAEATRLPARTRWVLRVAWVGLLVGVAGRAAGLLAEDAARHAFTSVYLIPLMLVVGVRMLPRVSAYPIRFPRLTGTLLWAAVLGGTLRAFAGMADHALGWPLAWAGGLLLTAVVLIFALLAWSPWGVPRPVPREPEVRKSTPG